MGTLLSAALVLLALSSAAPAQTIAPAALQANLRFALDTIERQHPDLTYLKRETSGAVSAGTIKSATQPVADEPLHFPGKVTVEIGPLTYSSAVLFANVVRDYRFGMLTRIGGASRTQQSGAVRTVTLPNTGLILSYPRFVLDPPAGKGASKLLQSTTVN